MYTVCMHKSRADDDLTSMPSAHGSCGYNALSGRVKRNDQPKRSEAKACGMELVEEPYPQLLSLLDKSGCHLHIVSETRCQNALCHFVGDNTRLDHALPDTISLILQQHAKGFCCVVSDCQDRRQQYSVYVPYVH